MKRREAKSKGEKESYKHLNEEFQRIARRDKKAFISDRYKEIEETNRFPGDSDGKASAHNVGDPGWIPGSGRIPWRRKWQPTPVLLPRKFHEWRSLVGNSPWGRKESDTTEQLHFTLTSFQ